MRRLLVVAAAATLLLAVVPLVGAATPAPPRHVEGSWAALGDPYSATFLFEIRASAAGKVEFGYYQTDAMRAPDGELPFRSQGTVSSVRFFKAASGAPAAEFKGRECILAAADPAKVGTCPWYHIVVTDGRSIGKPDTFCGAQVPTECHVWNLTYGDIRIYTDPPAFIHNGARLQGRAETGTRLRRSVAAVLLRRAPRNPPTKDSRDAATP